MEAIRLPSHKLAAVDLEQTLGALHGWLGQKVEVSSHGGDGAEPADAGGARRTSAKEGCGEVFTRESGSVNGSLEKL